MERVLETVVERSRPELEAAKRHVPASELRRRIADAPPVRDFTGSLRKPGLRVIAELKAASPSKGVIRLPLEVELLAAELEAAGAAALSVLTERNFFLGGLENLERARKATDLPLLRKDFLYDEYQLLEARAAGADAVLLIAAMLSEAEFRTLHACAESLDLAVLCEAHTREELEMLASNGARIIGINARNLSTFDTSLDRVAELIQRVPERCVAVGESAIRERADLLRLHELGAQAFLIGETLMRAPSPGRKLCELLSK